MSTEAAFLDDIVTNPEDDTPRLVYADWLDDNDQPDRAEFIRVQCQLAKLGDRDRRRRALAKREEALLEAHRTEWTDLAFAEWLRHPKRVCRNPMGHDFCKVVGQGIRARCQQEALPEGDPRRTKLAKKLEDLGQRMEGEFEYLADTRDMPLFDRAEFRRGFLETAWIQDFALDHFAEALPALTVLRELDVENDALVDGMGDRAIQRLVAVLDRLPLASIDCHSGIEDLWTFEALAASPAARKLTKLALWYEGDETGDEAAAVLACSPYLTGLRELELEHSETFTDDAFLAVLDSPTLAGLVRCRLRPNVAMPLSRTVVRRFVARFGPDLKKEATIRRGTST